ncbi:MAG: hypothetical protein CMA28_00010 [Euryarchaeota archaeon]|nr:hypothetical protein [Euryarchaeota archaeon]
MAEERPDSKEEDSERIGTEISTEDVDSSRIAGRDISSKTVYHGVDPKEHAELLSKLAMLEGRLRETEDSVEDETDEEQVIHHGVNPEDHAELISRIARLEERLRATEYPKENMTRGEKTGVPPLRETWFYSKTIGWLVPTTRFSGVAILLSLILFIYAMEGPFPIATDSDVEDCEAGLKQPGEIDQAFEGMTCEEMDQSREEAYWDEFEWITLSALILFGLGFATLLRPSWNPMRIVNNTIGSLETPYRTVGLLSFFLGPLLLVGYPDFDWESSVNVDEYVCCFSSCTFFLWGLSLLFVSARWDESGSVSMELGDGEDITD